MSQIRWELELGEYDRNMEAEKPEMEPVQPVTEQRNQRKSYHQTSVKQTGKWNSGEDISGTGLFL